LENLARPSWKVLDIGSGGGVLALPLAKNNCNIVAIEPSSAMRSLINRNAININNNDIMIDTRRWEDVSVQDYYKYDLIIACNSLHLTSIGFRDGLCKIFHAGPKNIFVVTEKLYPAVVEMAEYSNYTMFCSASYEVESSFVYHNIDEAIEHWTLLKGSVLKSEEQDDIISRLVCRDSHYVIRDRACINLFWWKETDEELTMIKTSGGI